MKKTLGKKYFKIGAIAFVVIILSIVFKYSLENGTKIAEAKAIIDGTLWPIIAGFIMAYLLNPILNFFERCCFQPVLKFVFRDEAKEIQRNKLSRTFGILCTMILFFVILIGGLYLVIPQVYASLVKIVSDIPDYYNEIEQWIISLDKDKSEVSKYLLMGLDRGYSQGMQYLNEEILPNVDKIVVGVTSGIVGGLKAILNLVLAVIISIYVMASKESLICVGKKITYSIFSLKNANSVLRGIRYADNVFGGFINGKIIDSFIIGAICYLFMVLAQFDYAILISIVVGVTNVIPYFGPFIGAIPSTLILFMMSPKQGLIFAVFVVILQQVDGNIIGPLILGDRLKISSMWILFAILVGGGLFGVAGMILGAPCFACLYAFVGTVCRSRLKNKNLPVETEAYYTIHQIEVQEDRLDEGEEKQLIQCAAGKEKNQNIEQKQDKEDKKKEKLKK